MYMYFFDSKDQSKTMGDLDREMLRNNKNQYYGRYYGIVRKSEK